MCCQSTEMEVDRKLAEKGKWTQANLHSFVKSFCSLICSYLSLKAGSFQFFPRGNIDLSKSLIYT